MIRESASDSSLSAAKTSNEAGSLLDQWRKTYGMEAIPTEVFNHPKLIEIMNGLKSDISLLGKDVMETLNQSSVTRALNSAILMIDEKDSTQSLLRFQKSESALINDYQLKEFVNLVKIGEIDLAVAQQTFLKRFYELVASEIDYQDEVLSDFDALRHQEDVDNFIEGDKFHLSGTAQRVMDLIGISTVAKQNEYPQKDQIVKQEMNKKTNCNLFENLWMKHQKSYRLLNPVG